MKKRFKKGFTLVEMLVSVGIFVIIAIVVGNFNGNIFFINSNVQSGLNAQFEARRVLKTIISELRTASPSSLGAYPISSAATSTITFYSNIDSDAYKERLRYFLQGTDFKRGVLKPSGNPLVYNSAQESVQVLLHNVVATSTPIFDYYPETYAGTTSPLSIPVDVTAVRLVRATITIDPDPRRAPRPMTVSSEVMLRNLKNNQ